MIGRTEGKEFGQNPFQPRMSETFTNVPLHADKEEKSNSRDNNKYHATAIFFPMD